MKTRRVVSCLTVSAFVIVSQFSSIPASASTDRVAFCQKQLTAAVSQCKGQAHDMECVLDAIAKADRCATAPGGVDIARQGIEPSESTDDIRIN